MNFEQDVLKSTQPVLVDFWAEWCGPCRMLSPVLDEVADELKAKIVKINIDEHPELASTYSVRSIPTLILFKDGKAIETRIGGMSKAQLKEWIESAS